MQPSSNNVVYTNVITYYSQGNQYSNYQESSIQSYEKDQRISRLKQQVRHLQDARQADKQELKALKLRQAQIRLILKKKDTELTAAERKVERLNHEVIHLNSKLGHQSSLQAIVGELSSELNRLQGVLQYERITREECQNHLNIISRELTELKQIETVITKEKTSLHVRLTRSGVDYKKLEKEYQAVQEKCKQLEEKDKTLKERCENLEEKNAAQLEMINDLNKRYLQNTEGNQEHQQKHKKAKKIIFSESVIV